MTWKTDGVTWGQKVALLTACELVLKSDAGRINQDMAALGVLVDEHREPEKKGIAEYPETHQTGLISIENLAIHKDIPHGDFGVQIASDGRVWVCIDGVSILRFKPMSVEHYRTMSEAYPES